MSDTVQILRIILYEGERAWAENQVAISIHGTKVLPKGKITVTTLSEFPHILSAAKDETSG